MKCSIYRCSARADMYLYVPVEDGIDKIPHELLTRLGSTHLAMELDIISETKLSKGNADDVLRDIENQGFHLQMPANQPVEELMKNIGNQTTLTPSGKDTLH